MAVKYRADYKSVNDIDYRIDISKPSYLGDVVNIIGSAVYGRNSIDNSSHPIRSKYCRLNLLITQENDLSDLFATDEREWTVELYRGGNKIFFGYLSTEGAEQSFVTKERFVEFSALDPLAFLEDLAYVGTGGLPLTGKASIIEIISRCLIRAFESTSNAFNILTYCNYDYQTITYGVEEYLDYTDGLFLEEVEIYQENYRDLESGEAQSCQSVLIKILKDLDLCITQVNGSTWLIGHCLGDNSTIDPAYINSYNYLGDSIADISGSYFDTVALKQDSDTVLSTDVLHASSNQSFRYNRGLKSKTYNWQYRYRESLTLNNTFDGGTDGSLMPDWTIDNTYTDPSSLGYIDILRTSDPADNTLEVLRSNSNTIIDVNEDDVLFVRGSFMKNNDDTNVQLAIQVRAESVTGTGVWYLRPNGDQPYRWSPITGSSTPKGNAFFIDGIENETVNFEWLLPPFQDNMDDLLYLEVLTFVLPSTTTPVGSEIRLYDLGIFGSSGTRIGTTYKTTATNDKSFKSEIDTIEHNLSDAGSKTNTFYRVTTNKPVHAIKNKFILNASDADYFIDSIGGMKGVLDIYNNRKKIFFSGNFWNFYEPSNIISISDISSNYFIALEYEFDTYQNQGIARYEEVFTDYIANSIEEKPIISETIKPTIE